MHASSLAMCSAFPVADPYNIKSGEGDLSGSDCGVVAFVVVFVVVVVGAGATVGALVLGASETVGAFSVSAMPTP